MEDLAQSFTSHYPLTAHPMHHKNNINRKRLKNNAEKKQRSLHKWMRVSKFFCSWTLEKVTGKSREKCQYVTNADCLAKHNKTLGFSLAACYRVKM